MAADIRTPDDAMLVLQALLKYRPKALDSRRLLRTISVDVWEAKQGSFNPLKKLQTEAISLKSMTFLAQAEKAKQESKFEDMMELAEKILAHQPTHERANLLLAEAAGAQSDYGTVAFAYEMICYDQSNSHYYLHHLAEAYGKAGDFAAAGDTYRRILENKPDDRDAQAGLKNTAASIAQREASLAAYQEFAGTPVEEPPEPAAVDPAQEPFAAIDVAEFDAQLEDLDARIQMLSPSGSSTAEELEEWERLQHERKYVALQRAYQQATEHIQDKRMAMELGQAYVDMLMFPEAMQIYEGIMSDPEMRLECYRAMTVCMVRQLAQQQLAEQGAPTDPEGEQQALAGYMAARG